MAGRNKN